MSQTTPSNTNPNLYRVLDLPTPTSAKPPITPKQIKAAYRRALLLHHPDKFDDEDKSQPVPSVYTIDDITEARNILLNPTLRHEHDRALLLSGDEQVKPGCSALLNPTELETVDLDDMAYSGAEKKWTRSCRCGNQQAFEVTEDDLIESLVNEEDGEGELLVGCDGCSLHIRVIFGVAEDDEHNNEVPPEQQMSKD